MQSTIYENFVLPSKGMVYDEPFDPNVTLRSMTTVEEMQRLSPTTTPYKVMSDIIQSCIKDGDKLPISVYDMCIGDYQFLLHKLRIVTYGPEYLMSIKCPNCEQYSDVEADLESLAVYEWDEEYDKAKIITLPKSGDLIELKPQTPRDLDAIEYRAKEATKRSKGNSQFKFLYTLMANIKTVNGRKLNSLELEQYCKDMGLNDANFILNRASDLNERIGLDTMIEAKCPNCGYELVTSFRITSEFFGPTNY